MTSYKAFITGRNHTFQDEEVAGGGTQILSEGNWPGLNLVALQRLLCTEFDS